MVLRNISIKNYGPIDDLSYTFRFDETGKPIPLVLIGKNGCGKTLLLLTTTLVLISFLLMDSDPH